MEIDESRQYAAPGFFGRLRDALFSAILAVLLFQVALFLGLHHFFGYRTIFYLFDNPIFIAVIGIAVILGFIVGRPFYNLLASLLDDWWIFD